MTGCGECGGESGNGFPGALRHCALGATEARDCHAARAMNRLQGRTSSSSQTGSATGSVVQLDLGSRSHQWEEHPAMTRIRSADVLLTGRHQVGDGMLTGCHSNAVRILSGCLRERPCGGKTIASKDAG